MIDLTQEQLEAMLADAADRGAQRALARLGLHDENAMKDVDELRGLLGAWRLTKRTAWKATIGLLVKAVFLALLAGVLVKTGHLQLNP